VAKIGLLILVMVFLTSCSSTAPKINQDMDKLKDEHDNGYMLIGIDNSHDIHSLRISGPDKIKLTWEDLEEGKRYFLLEVEAGHYALNDVKFNRWLKAKFKAGKWNFSIKASNVNYVGHLDISFDKYASISSAYIQLENRSSEALKYMQSNFPNILKSRRMIYQGPGTDNYLQYFEELTNKGLIK